MISVIGLLKFGMFISIAIPESAFYESGHPAYRRGWSGFPSGCRSVFFFFIRQVLADLGDMTIYQVHGILLYT